MKKILLILITLFFAGSGLWAQNTKVLNDTIKANNEETTIIAQNQKNEDPKKVKKVPRVKQKQKPKKLKKLSKKQALLQKQKIRQNFRRKLRNAK